MSFGNQEKKLNKTSGEYHFTRLETVVFGVGKVDALGSELSRRGAERALIVTGKTLGRSKLLEKVKSAAGSGMAVALDRDARARSRGRGFVLDAPSAGYRHAREQGDRAAERAPAAVAANAWRRRTRASRAMPARGVALDFRHVVELARRNLARVGASDRADVERPARHHVMHHAAARDALDGRRRRRSLRTDRARFRGALRPAKSTLIGDGMRRSHGQVHRQVRRADPAS